MKWYEYIWLPKPKPYETYQRNGYTGTNYTALDSVLLDKIMIRKSFRCEFAFFPWKWPKYMRLKKEGCFKEGYKHNIYEKYSTFWESIFK